MEIFLRRLKSLSILPVPSTTEERGSFARVTGKPVSSRIRLSKFLSIDPPPVKTIPLSTISPESSGGVCSSATRIALMIVPTHSDKASRISSSVITRVLGIPSIKLRPLISTVTGSSRGKAEPTSILICSAVLSFLPRRFRSRCSFYRSRTDK